MTNSTPPERDSAILHAAIEARLAAHRDFVISRFESIELATEQRQKFRDRITDDLKDQMRDMESRMNEKFEARDKALEKAEVFQNERMNQIYAFRDLIISESKLFVTRDQLDVTNKGMEDQIDIVRRAAQLAAGRDAGVSRVWQVISIAFSLLAAAGTVVLAINQVLFRSIH